MQRDLGDAPGLVREIVVRLGGNQAKDEELLAELRAARKAAHP